MATSGTRHYIGTYITSMGKQVSTGGGNSSEVGRAFAVAGGVSSVDIDLEVTYITRSIPLGGVRLEGLEEICSAHAGVALTGVWSTRRRDVV
jgi:hypothetical protein